MFRTMPGSFLSKIPNPRIAAAEAVTRLRSPTRTPPERVALQGRLPGRGLGNPQGRNAKAPRAPLRQHIGGEDVSWTGPLLVPEGQCPRPRRSYRCRVHVQGTPDDGAVGKHVKIIVAPLAGRAAGWARLRISWPMLPGGRPGPPHYYRRRGVSLASRSNTSTTDSVLGSSRSVLIQSILVRNRNA
jgi:hypothetical protein